MGSQTSSREVRDLNQELFGHVIEAEMGRLDFDALMYKFWRRDMITAERKRIRQTWFDYRHIHPVLRSFAFLKEYELAHVRAHKRFYGEVKDKSRTLPSRGASRSLYRRSARSITMTITRMHLVDELGCPYDSFFDAAFNHFMQDRSFEQVWKDKVPAFRNLDLPPITVLADDAASLITAQKAFETRNSYRMRLPQHPHYLAENWIGSPQQKECAGWLIKATQTRPDRNVALARLCYEAGLLRENEVARRLGIDVVKSMRSIRSTILSHN